jgi:hypothetical protein
MEEHEDQSTSLLALLYPCQNQTSKKIALEVLS